MKNFQIEYKWAFILTVLGIVWIALERAAGLHDQHIDMHPIYTNIVVLPSILVYYLALREKKSIFFKNHMDWKQGFLSGSVMAIFAALMAIPAVFFSLKVVSPNFFANQIKYQMEVHGRTLETATAYFNMNTYLITSAIGSISFGIVVSAIVAYFLKSKTQKA